MKSFLIKEDLIDYTKELIANNNFGNRGFFDGSTRNQFIGILGENCIRDYLGVSLLTADGFDGGYDIEWNDYKLDVKTMERKVEPREDFVNNVFDVQMKFQSDGFVFCSINTKTKNITICGWTTKSNLKEKGNFYPVGTKRYRTDGSYFTLLADTWEIENRYLQNWMQ
jgi:hypothetical protein